MGGEAVPVEGRDAHHPHAGGAGGCSARPGVLERDARFRIGTEQPAGGEVQVGPLSTTEAEYVAAASCCTQLLWMMQTLQDIQITCTPPISILSDNTSDISISKNPVMHSKNKHILIKYNFLHQQVLEQKVKLEYVPSKE